MCNSAPWRAKNLLTGSCAIIPEILAKLGKFFDKAEGRPDTGAIYPRDERDVLAAGQRGVKGAVVAERERHPDPPPDGAAVGHLGPGQQPDQRRLAGAVGAEDAEIVPGGKFHGGVVEHPPAPGRGPV